VRANRPWAASAHPSVATLLWTGRDPTLPHPLGVGIRSATGRIETLRSCDGLQASDAGQWTGRPSAAPLHGRQQWRPACVSLPPPGEWSSAPAAQPRPLGSRESGREDVSRSTSATSSVTTARSPRRSRPSAVSGDLNPSPQLPQSTPPVAQRS
jgi:hypothetical protein